MNAVTFTSLGFWAAFAAVFLLVAGMQARWPKSTAKPALRKGLLLAFSLGFYVWVAQHLVWVLVVSVLLNHVAAQAIHRASGRTRSLCTAVGVALNVAMLATFKYAYFIAEWIPPSTLTMDASAWRLEGWMLPLGISFFTFQAISYLIDVHRGTVSQPASLLSFATYLTFFPQLVAGPIVRAKEFLPQLESKHWIASKAEDARHVQLILSGFLKKLVLGDLVGAWLVDPVFDDPTNWASWEILLALYGYSLQVYADFSGYTDMAKGMAGLLGIELPKNFRFPYRATSPSDFWRRWHMTLSSWWKDYLYIPLGGNRNVSAFTVCCALAGLGGAAWSWGELGGGLVVAGVALLVTASMLMSTAFHKKMATAMNVFLVMLVGGLWHGAHVNFIMWGALNGAVLAAWVLMPSRPSKAWKRALGWFVTFHSVVLARIWFRAGSLIAWDETTSAPHPEDAWGTASLLWERLQLSPPSPMDMVWDATYLTGVALLVSGYALHWIPEPWRNIMHKKTTSLPMWATWCFWCAATALAVWCSSSYHKPFIYWQF